MPLPQLTVGIDVSLKRLDVAFLGPTGEPVRSPDSFGNEPQGWTELKTAVVAAAPLVGKRVHIVCALEATGDLHKRAEQALRGEKRRKLDVRVVNPLSVRQFKKMLLKDCKTDELDARMIALYALRMRPDGQAPVPEGFEELREAARLRRRLVEEKTDAKNRLHKLLRYHFPGYQEFLGKTLVRRVLLAFAEMPAPGDILERGVEAVAAMKNGGHHRFGRAFAEALAKLAAQAPSRDLRVTTRLFIQNTARRVLELEAQIAEMDGLIETMLDEVFPDHPIRSIPGVGKVSAAAILAEVGDFARFRDKTHFVGYCGLYPVSWESGETKLKFRMTWKGNRMLKMTLLLASAAARQYNPAVAAFYERLRRRGKGKKAAGGAIARKLAEIVYAISISGEAWSAEKAMKGIRKGEEMAAARETKREPVSLTGARPETQGAQPSSRSPGSPESIIAGVETRDNRKPILPIRRDHATMTSIRREDRAPLESDPSARAEAIPVGDVRKASPFSHARNAHREAPKR